MEYSKYGEWDKKEQHDFQIWLRTHLHFGPTKVTFTKKDGTVREMNCTLKPDLVIDYEKKTDKTKNVSEETCPVFDIDKQEWRSFRYDSITSITFET